MSKRTELIESQYYATTTLYETQHLRLEVSVPQWVAADAVNQYDQWPTRLYLTSKGDYTVSLSAFDLTLGFIPSSGYSASNFDVRWAHPTDPGNRVMLRVGSCDGHANTKTQLPTISNAEALCRGNNVGNGSISYLVSGLSYTISATAPAVTTQGAHNGNTFWSA